MGIDIYLEWDNMTKDEKEEQYGSLFMTNRGEIGYLREAYHGKPYATAVLFPEDWDSQPKGGFVINNEVLVSRLKSTIYAAIEREVKIYEVKDRSKLMDTAMSYIKFVELHGVLEKAGKNPRIIISY